MLRTCGLCGAVFERGRDPNCGHVLAAFEYNKHLSLCDINLRQDCDRESVELFNMAYTQFGREPVHWCGPWIKEHYSDNV